MLNQLHHLKFKMSAVSQPKDYQRFVCKFALSREKEKNRSHKWTGTINCWLIWFVYVNWQEGMLQKAHLFSHGGWMHWMNALAGRPGLGPAKVSSWSVEWRSPPRWCLNWVVCGWAFNQANQRQLQPFFIMSPSDLLATQVLNAFKNVALAIVTERHMKKTNLKQQTTCKQCYPASTFPRDTTQTQNWSQNSPFQDSSAPSCSTRHSPLLNSRLNSELRLHYVHRCSQHAIPPRSKWTSSRSNCSKEKR